MCPFNSRLQDIKIMGVWDINFKSRIRCVGHLERGEHEKLKEQMLTIIKVIKWTILEGT